MEAYLDNSATTPLCRKAKERMVDSIENIWGNPSSLHEKGIEADNLLKGARKLLASLLSASERRSFSQAEAQRVTTLPFSGRLISTKEKETA